MSAASELSVEKPKNTKRRGKISEAPSEVNGTTKGKARNPAKSKASSDKMPLAARTTGLRMFIGAHVSAAGGTSHFLDFDDSAKVGQGVHNAVENSTNIGGNAFALFLKSQRKWANPSLKDEHRDEFKRLSKEAGYDAAKHVLPHGSYLVNLAQADKEKAQQAYESFIDDCK